MGVKIEVKDISKKLHGNMILKNVSLTMEPGKIYGFRGRNGSGKTMLFRAICGLMRTDRGEITIDGKRIGSEISFPPSVGILIENPAFLEHYTAFENLSMIASINNIVGKERIREVIETVGLNPDDARKVKRFSLGMKQRLGIAQAILEKPELLLLDEPTNALDREGVAILEKVLMDAKAEGVTIGIASHEKEDLEKWSDRIFGMQAGELFEGEML